MLNISHTTISEKFDSGRFKTFQNVMSLNTYFSVTKTIMAFMGIVILILFLPWTQNVQGEGMVTTLAPEHRPQTIQSVISGRVEKWYKQEGAYVSKGDTILSIVEIQDAFFDPKLIPRMAEQIRAREGGQEANVSRIGALRDQIIALEKTRDIKIEQIFNKIRQAELKVNTDSIRYKAAQTEQGHCTGSAWPFRKPGEGWPGVPDRSGGQENTGSGVRGAGDCCGEQSPD
jgi:membrane fusion protein, adhesin transport system